MKIYIDGDGVIFNSVEKLFDEFHNIVDNLGLKISRAEYLYYSVEWNEWLESCGFIKGSFEYLKENKKAIVLTKVFSSKEAKAKVSFMRRNKLKNDVIVVHKDLRKTDVVRAKNNILVDDTLENLNHWHEAGGKAIFFSKLGDNLERFDGFEKENTDYPMISNLNEIEKIKRLIR